MKKNILLVIAITFLFASQNSVQPSPFIDVDFSKDFPLIASYYKKYPELEAQVKEYRKMYKKMCIKHNTYNYYYKTYPGISVRKLVTYLAPVAIKFALQLIQERPTLLKENNPNLNDELLRNYYYEFSFENVLSFDQFKLLFPFSRLNQNEQDIFLCTLIKFGQNELSKQN